MSSLPRPSLLVFGKKPTPGAVKTRLCPPFTPEEAAALYAEMLDDVLEASAAHANALGLDPLLAVWPPDAAAELARRAPGDFAVVVQRGEDLSSRMDAAFAEQWAAGRPRVLLRGSDSPALDRAVLEEALAALDRVDCVLCPDLDGGYNLVGLRRPAPGLFDHPMSTDRVLEATRSRAVGLGLSVHVLPARFDVDTAEDLAHLARAREAGRARDCPRTLAWLDAHGARPEPRVRGGR